LAEVGPALEFARTLADRPDDDPASYPVASRLVRSAFEVLLDYERRDDPPTFKSPQFLRQLGLAEKDAAAVAWTAGLIRKGLVYYGSFAGLTSGQLQAALVEHLSAEYSRLTRRIPELEVEAVAIEQREAKARRWEKARLMIPSEGRDDRIIKYESHVTKWLFGTLHELERLQDTRASPEVPVAVEVGIDLTANEGPVAGND
jgi:hypothetical protein